LKATARWQLPRSQHLGPLSCAVAAPPPVARITRIGAAEFGMLGTAIPRTAAGVPIGSDRATGTAARAAGSAGRVEFSCRGRQSGRPAPKANEQRDGESVCTLHDGCFGRRAAAASIWLRLAGASPTACPACPNLPARRSGPLNPRRWRWIVSETPRETRIHH
jgi:hypothetical protein